VLDVEFRWQRLRLRGFARTQRLCSPQASALAFSLITGKPTNHHNDY
jgi:hypothetical protein